MKRRFATSILVNLATTMVCVAGFQVNTHAPNDQRNAEVAMYTDGSFLVLWTSYLQDGSSNGIFGQRFDPNASPVGEEFQVNTTSSGNQTEPAADVTAAGFVVTWHGPGSLAEDEEDVFARQFDPNGLPIGEEFLVNSYTDGGQMYPDVAANHDGSFVIVWESENVPAEGDKAICGRLYGANGVAAGQEFTISVEASACRYPSVAADVNGAFATVWLDDRSTNSIIGRLFDPNGSPRTDEFQVNSTPFGSVTRPSIAMDSEGYFVVAWDGDPNRAALDDIHARVFEPNGVPLGEQFLVNTTIDGQQRYPQVALNETAEFVIVWEGVLDPNANERDIFARGFNNFGDPLGNEYQLNTYAEGDQRYPVAALDGDGKFVAAWQSYDQDGSRYGIFAAKRQLVGSADFNSDGLVDLHDYRILAEQWLEQGPALPADLVFDDRVDAEDLAEFCRQWLTTVN